MLFFPLIRQEVEKKRKTREKIIIDLIDLIY